MDLTNALKIIISYQVDSLVSGKVLSGAILEFLDDAHNSINLYECLAAVYSWLVESLWHGE